MVETTQIRIGRRVKELREKSKMKQKDVAEALNISVSAYAKLEAGDRGISSENCIALADLFGVSCDYILRGIDAEYLDICKETILMPETLAILKQHKAEIDRLRYEITDTIRILNNTKKQDITYPGGEERKNIQCLHITECINEKRKCLLSHKLEAYFLNSLITNNDFSTEVRRALLRIADDIDSILWIYSARMKKQSLLEIRQESMGIDSAQFIIERAFSKLLSGITTKTDFMRNDPDFTKEQIQEAINGGLLHE